MVARPGVERSRAMRLGPARSTTSRVCMLTRRFLRDAAGVGSFDTRLRRPLAAPAGAPSAWDEGAAPPITSAVDVAFTTNGDPGAPGCAAPPTAPSTSSLPGDCGCPTPGWISEPTRAPLPNLPDESTGAEVLPLQSPLGWSARPASPAAWAANTFTAPEENANCFGAAGAGRAVSPPVPVSDGLSCAILTDDTPGFSLSMASNAPLGLQI